MHILMNEDFEQKTPLLSSSAWYRRDFVRVATKIVLAGIVCLIAIFFYEAYLPHASYVGAQEIIISPGLGSREIGALLKQNKIIRSQWVFVMYLSLRGQT